jgi:teichuronic acid biosynthesis protein TuaE
MYLFYLLCGISIVLVIIYHAVTLENLNRIFKVLAIMFVIEIILSLLETFNILRLPISPYSSWVKYFGRESALNSELPVKVQKIFSETPTGFQWNQNNLAIVMNILLPFFLFAKSVRIKVLGVITIFIVVYATDSRGNLVTFFFIIAIYLGTLNKYRFFYRFFAVLLIIFSITIGFNFSKLKSNQIVDSFKSINTFLNTRVIEKNSLGQRQRYIYNGLVALKNSHGLGVGAGNSGNAEYHKDVVGNSPRISMHNFWIEVLVDSGVIFALLFYSWYIYITLSLYRIYRRSLPDSVIRYYSIASALSLLGFVIGSVSGSSVIYDFPMWILFGFSIAVINISRNSYQEINLDD